MPSVFGGAGGGFSTVFKTADEIITSDDTLTDDADLQFEVDKNSVYAYKMVLLMSSSVNADFKYFWTGPVGATMSWFEDQDSNVGVTAKTITTQDNMNGAGVAVLTIQWPEGLIITGANAGILNFQWAQLTSEATNTTLRKGSWILFKKLN